MYENNQLNLVNVMYDSFQIVKIIDEDGEEISSKDLDAIYTLDELFDNLKCDKRHRSFIEKNKRQLIADYQSALSLHTELAKEARMIQLEFELSEGGYGEDNADKYARQELRRLKESTKEEVLDE